MDTNDLQDRASKLLRALEDGDANRARDMLHGEDALEVALTVAIRSPLDGSSLTDRALCDVLAILAAERMARDAFARTTGGAKLPSYYEVPRDLRGPELGNPSGIVRDLAALDHGRAVAELYADGEEVR